MVEVLEGSIPVRRRFQQGEGRWRVVALAAPMATTSVGAVASLLDDFLALAPELRARGTSAARRGGAFARELAELRGRIAADAPEAVSP